jgi:hypothetical protein
MQISGMVILTACEELKLLKQFQVNISNILTQISSRPQIRKVERYEDLIIIFTGILLSHLSPAWR